MSTLRLIIPQWQGGLNPNYVFGSELLACIAPPSTKDKTVKIKVSTDFDKKLNKINGIDGGEILLVSQFSLAGTLGKGTGNRPDFGHAELPDRARELYERVRDKLRAEGLTVKTGVFGAHMYIEQKQDGPLSFVFEC